MNCKIKKCITCKIEQSETEFYKFNKQSKYRQSVCRTCSKLATRVYVNKRRIEYKQKLVSLFGNKCNHCLNSFESCVYDFHHKEPKEFGIAWGIMSGRKSWEKILKEAQKCVMLCSNCHRIHHFGKEKIEC